MKGIIKISTGMMIGISFISLFIIGGCSYKNESQQIEATGTIEMTETTVNSKSNGRVVKILTDEGQAVKAGDLLAELDHEELDAQIAAAESNLDVAIANYDAAKTDLARNRQLYQAQQISASQFDQAATKNDVTKAQVGQAKANLDLLKVQLKNVKIFAPDSGLISEKLIENGEVIASGTSLFTLLDYQKPWVKVYLPLKEVSKVKLNEKAYVTLDAFPNRKFYGRISFISKEAEFTPKDFLSKEERIKQVFAVKVQLINEENILKAGIPVDVTIEENK
jgi:HlyD family secretion protein